MTHRFIEIASSRLKCYELSFNGEEQLISNWQGVCPPVMPGNEVLLYQWVPARKDPHTGKEIETHRLRLYRVPVGAKGPRPAEITRLLDEMEIPKEVQLPEALEIPPAIKALKRTEECEVIAAKMGVQIPQGADLKTVHVLLAREAANTQRGKDVLAHMIKSSEPVGKAEPAAA